MKFNGIFLFILLIGMIGASSAAPTPTQALPSGQILRISSESGETYINWVWKSEPLSVAVPPVNILIDDAQTPTIYNYKSNSFLVDGLDGGSRHNIALYNSTDWALGIKTVLGRGTTTTLKPAYEIYFLIAVTIGLMVLTILIGNDLVKLILLSIFNILICLFGMSLSNGRGLLLYLFIGIGVVTTIILIVNALPKIQEEIAWF